MPGRGPGMLVKSVNVPPTRMVIGASAESILCSGLEPRRSHRPEGASTTRNEDESAVKPKNVSSTMPDGQLGRFRARHSAPIGTTLDVTLTAVDVARCCCWWWWWWWSAGTPLQHRMVPLQRKPKATRASILEPPPSSAAPAASRGLKLSIARVPAAAYVPSDVSRYVQGACACSAASAPDRARPEPHDTKCPGRQQCRIKGILSGPGVTES
eukprot:COSAG02_NODE_3489_length_6660_cov_19.136707_6_plen_212_part_00